MPADSIRQHTARPARMAPCTQHEPLSAEHNEDTGSMERSRAPNHGAFSITSYKHKLVYPCGRQQQGKHQAGRTAAPRQTETAAVTCAHTARARVREDPVLRPDISPRLPCSAQLNTNVSRHRTHLSASSGPCLLCGCGTPTAPNSVLRTRRCGLLQDNLAVLGCDGVPLSDCVRASADPKSTAPGVAHRSARLDQPTATPVHCVTPEGSHPRCYSRERY